MQALETGVVAKGEGRFGVVGDASGEGVELLFVVAAQRSELRLETPHTLLQRGNFLRQLSLQLLTEEETSRKDSVSEGWGKCPQREAKNQPWDCFNGLVHQISRRGGGRQQLVGLKAEERKDSAFVLRYFLDKERK